MKHRRPLYESLDAKMYAEPAADIQIDNAIHRWGSVNYGPLAVVLAHLRFLAALHQFHHWTSKGSQSYGDHLLFERLYTETAEEVDDIAEKAIGLGGPDVVELLPQLSTVCGLAKEFSMSAATVQSDAERARRSLQAEYSFLKVVDVVCEHLDRNGQLTTGLDNLLAAICDTHESHVYLLKQRAC